MTRAHREFCTLFDSNYLFKAVAMYVSLERHCPSFHLTAFCFDEQADRLLGRLGLPHLSTVSLNDLESFDHELAATRADRTPLEYCCTATPASDGELNRNTCDASAASAPSSSASSRYKAASTEGSVSSTPPPGAVQYGGWSGFDPANRCPEDLRYVIAAVGLDYLDTAPVKGVYRGSGEATWTARLELGSLADAPR